MPCDICGWVSLARYNLVAAVGYLVIFTVEYLWVG